MLHSTKRIHILQSVRQTSTPPRNDRSRTHSPDPVKPWEVTFEKDLKNGLGYNIRPTVVKCEIESDELGTQVEAMAEYCARQGINMFRTPANSQGSFPAIILLTKAYFKKPNLTT
ncbi:hypothetical protein PENTCL1PPCAC_8457, partial [Pristionchus entomophagus]